MERITIVSGAGNRSGSSFSNCDDSTEERDHAMAAFQVSRIRNSTFEHDG